MTPAQQKAIEAIERMEAEQAGPPAAVGIPDALMPPQRPVIGMDDLLAVPTPQPTRQMSESEQYRQAFSDDVNNAVDKVANSKVVQGAVQGLQDFGAGVKKVFTGPDHPIPVNLGSSHIQPRIKGPKGEDLQLYSDGKYYPAGTDLSKPQGPQLNPSDKKAVGDFNRMADGGKPPADVGEDPKIQNYAASYGLSYSAAEAILRGRGYGRK